MEAAQLPSRRSKRQRTHTTSCRFCAQRSGGAINHAPVSARAPIFRYDDDDGDPDLARFTCNAPWADLGDSPAGLIAERVLAYDVADYIRFRAVCRSWRRCSVDPRAHGGLDRRFHPWRWIMLREKLDVPRFLNTSTAECIQVGIPELHGHEMVAVTPEGLLVLIRKPQYATIRLLNPLTHHLIELPPLTTPLPQEIHYKLSEHYIHYPMEFAAWGSGVANYDSTIVLCFHELRVLGMTKPGDDHWTLLKYQDDVMKTPLMFAGHFYCVNLNGVMVLETGPDQPPRLKVAARLNFNFSSFAHSVHLVNNFGKLMLVHRRGGYASGTVKWVWRYDLYKVDLDIRTLIPVKSLGGTGRAVFMDMDCSLSVSLEVFPSGSIRSDTIYLSFDVGERWQLEVGAYHLEDGSIERPNIYKGGLMPRPYTLIDCLSLSNTIEY